jgi:peroxiredoxin (alkyl hydroperoxide reductase subunit C)
MAVEVGQHAPEFTLKNQNNQQVVLSSFFGDGGKNVLLVFFPLAFSGICTNELCEVRDDLSTFQNDAVQVIGVSVDQTYAMKTWADKEGYDFPLLSDFWPHGAVAQKYGVFNEVAGIANRGTFLIDTAGVVQFAEVNEPGQRRDQSAWKAALSKLS